MDDPHGSPGNGRNKIGGLIPALIAFVAFLALIALGYQGSLILFALPIFSIILIIMTVEKRAPVVKPRPQAAAVDEEAQASTQVNFWAILGMAFVLVMAVIVVGGLLPNRSGRKYGQLTACKSNLKNMGTALEMYSCDNIGRYPHSLVALTPSYLKVLPTCPTAGAYSYAYYFSINPDAYTMCCSGQWHKSIVSSPDFPQYDSIQGLIDRP